MAGEDSLRILISAILKSDSIPTIEKQLKELKTKYGDMTIDVKIDKSVIDTLSKFNSNINQVTDSINKETATINRQAEATNKATEAQKKYNVEKQKTKEDADKTYKTTTNTTGTKFNNTTTSNTAYSNGESVEHPTIRHVDYAGQERANIAEALAIEKKYNDDFAKLLKEEETIDKAHYQALKTVEDQALAYDKNHYTALKMNKEMYVKDLTRLYNEQEKMDRAHYQALNTDQQRTEALDKQHYIALQQNAKRENDINDTKIALQTKIDNMKRRFGESIDTKGLDELSTRVGQINTRTVDWQRGIKGINQDLDKFSAGVKTSGSHMVNFAEAFQQAITKFPIWMAASTLFFQSLHFFTDGISYVNELNKSLTEISIVTGKSQAQVAQLGKDYQKLGSEISMTSLEISKGAASLFRQGLGENEVKQRMIDIGKFSKIASLEFSQSVEIITATINSMNVSAKKASDVFSFLGDATSSGADEVARGFAKMGSSVSTLKIPFEFAASLLATLSAKTRESADTLGNSIKSQLARYQSLKETGFTEEGQSVNEVSKALDTIGVKLIDAQGNFRNYMDVIQETAAVFPTLTNREQAYIATSLAGTFQQNRFYAIMSAMPDTIKLYGQSLDSAGISNQKFSQYAEGTEAHLATLRNSMEGLFQNTFNSEGLRGLIDTLTSLVTGVSKVIDIFGFLPTTVFAAVTALVLFNTTSRTLAMNIIPSMLGGTGNLSKFFRVLSFDLKGLGVAGTFAVGSLSGLRVALTSLLISTGVGVAIAGLVWAVSALIQNNQKLAEQQRQLEAQNKQVTESWSTQKDTITSLATEYEKLNDNKNRTVEQEQRYLEITDQLQKLMPNLVSSIDSKGKAHLLVGDAMQRELEYAEKLTRLEQAKELTTSKKDFNSILSERKELENQLKEVQDKINAQSKGLSTGGAVSGSGGLGYHAKSSEADLASLRIQALGIEQQIASMSDHINEKVTSLTGTILQMSGIKVGDTISSELNKILSSIDTSHMKDSELLSLTEKVSAAIKNLQTVANDPDSKYASVEKATQSFKDLFISLGQTNSQADAFVNTVLGITPPVVAATKQTNELGLSIKDMGKFITETEKTLKPLNQAIRDVSAGNKLSSQSIAELVVQYPELASAIKVTADGYTIELSALETARQGKIDKFNSDLEAEKNSTLITLTNTQSRITAYGVELQNIKTLADAKAALNGIKTQQSRAKYGVAGVGFGVNLGIDGFNPVQGFIDQQDESADLAVKAINDAIAKVSGATGQIDALKNLLGNKDYGLGKAPKEPKPKAEKAIKDNTQSETKRDMNEFARANRDLDNQIVLSQDHLANLSDTSAEYRKELKSQIPIYKAKQDLAHKEAESLREANGVILDKLKNDKLSANDRNKLLNDLDANETEISKLGHSWYEYGKSASEATAKITDSLQKQNEEIKKTKEQQQKDSEDLTKEYIEDLKKIDQFNLDSKETQLKHDKELSDERIKGYENDIKALERSNELTDDNAEKAKKQTELSQLNTTLYLYQNDTLANISDEMAQQLGLVEAKADAIKRQNDLLKAQQELKTIKNEKNVRLFKDGTFQWVADPRKVRDAEDKLTQMTADNAKEKLSKVEDLNKSIKDKSEELAKFITDIERKQQKQSLQDKIDHEKDLQDESEKAFAKEKEAFDLHWKDVDLSTKLFLDGLKKTYGDKWEEILIVLRAKVKTAQELYAQLAGGNAQISVTSQPSSGNASVDAGTSYLNSKGQPVISMLPEVKARDDAANANQKKFLENMIATGTAGKKAWAIAELKKLPAFDTGGMLSILHEKELVLKPEDTKNFLEGIKIQRLNPLSNFKTPDLSSMISKVVSKVGDNVTNFYLDNVTIRANNATELMKNLKLQVNNR